MYGCFLEVIFDICAIYCLVAKEYDSLEPGFFWAVVFAPFQNIPVTPALICFQIRVKWNLEHGSRFQPGVASCSWDDEPDDDDDDFIEEEEIGVQGVLLEKSEDKERVPSIFEMQMRELDPEKVKSPEVMKPVPINTKKLLYKGITILTIIIFFLVFL